MIPVKKDEVDVVSTLGGRDIEMTIDTDALQHVMGVLRNMYSDTEYAVIRELATNAHDSHVEAGQSKPIEVTTPSGFSRFFKVKDYGVGMDEADIERIYSRYGVSTKRESNELTGYLGIGSKAPLAYTNQFSVTAVKAGKRILVTVGLDEEGVGTMTVNGPFDTDEPNGVEISVPSKRENEFFEKCERLFKYWPAGSVLLNGQPPERREKEIKITSEISLYPAEESYYYSRGNATLVMGLVPYPIDKSRISLDTRYGFDLVAHVPLGAVHLAPSREALNYTNSTMKVLDEIKRKLEEGIWPALQRDVEAQPTRFEALKKTVAVMSGMHYSYARVAEKKRFTYRGVTIPKGFTAAAGDTFLVTRAKPEEAPSWNANAGQYINIGKHEYMDSISITTAAESVYVTGFTQATFTHVSKKRLWEWFKLKNRELPKHFILVKNKLPAELAAWIPVGNIIPWAPISVIPLPKPKATGRGKYVNTYNVFIDGKLNWKYPARDIDKTKPIFWVEGNNPHDAGDHWTTRLPKFFDHYTLVVLQANRLTKFQRLFPTAREVRRVIDDSWNDWWESLSAGERELLSLERSYHTQELKSLPQVGINDPDVQRAVRLVRGTRIRPEIWERVNVFGRHRVPQAPDPLHKYPLVGTNESSPKRIREHNRLYINAVHAAEGEKAVA